MFAAAYRFLDSNISLFDVYKDEDNELYNIQKTHTFYSNKVRKNFFKNLTSMYYKDLTKMEL
jgi:hypothetical protein